MGSFSLIFLVFGILLGLTFTTAQICSTTGNFTANSTYGKNRDLILSSLPSNVSANGGFFTATMGEGADRVYALGLCRGDASTELCYNSINSSTQSLINTCTKQKEAIVWGGDPVSIVRYSDRNFFGKMELSPQPPIYYNSDKEQSSWNQFEQIWSGLMNDIVSRAAMGSSRLKFATQEANVTAFAKIHGLAQCTPDLSLSQCSDCLIRALGDYRTCCSGGIGGGVNKPSCMFTFESTSAGSATPPPPPIRNYPPPPLTDVTNKKGKGGNSSKTIIAIVVPIVVTSVLISMLCIFFLFKKTKTRQAKEEENLGDDFTTAESLQYNLSTVQAATNSFSSENKVGEGGFGGVYKGTLANGQEVAVKRLSRKSHQGAKEFKTEVVLVAKLQQRNLVRLLGFCLEGQEKILIYEFVPNKSLDYFLFDPEKQGQLDWSRRYKIIQGISRGIFYLHEDSRLRIIHRDLKASNVLLDEDMNPKISDFGMARIFGVHQTEANTNRIVGTYGYMSPEYAMHGQFSIKSDVYSFGVLILEIISGKKNNSFYQSECVGDLLSYAWKHWSESTALELMDPILSDSYSINEVMRCIHIALLCVQEDPDDRPTMATTVLMLNSFSFPAPLPHQPALFVRGKMMPKKNLELNQSTNRSMTSSVNGASITELEPR